MREATEECPDVLESYYSESYENTGGESGSLRNLTKTTETYEILRNSVFVRFQNLLQDCEKLTGWNCSGPQITHSSISNWQNVWIFIPKSAADFL